ncbi:MAG TPA: enoyl-CoA hydratase/isomerase family protein [Candidatus Dormibacteraeota bacterium]|nr:enoyl-CoA hydratase/isomerase family protein [Candidatus Dormibacteraeota bacterium]
MSSVKLSFEHDGQIARVALAAPKANIVDQAMMAALAAAFEDLRNRPQLKIVVLTGEGPHFSFGASVQEHLPEHVRAMLLRFGGLLGQLLELQAVTVAAVRGQCLGGGFELALACDFIVAEEGAQFACPEIKLAVFPPAAAMLLPARIGVSRATELVLTGAAWSAAQAAAAGLVVRTTRQGQLEAIVDTWIRDNFLARSRAALQYGARAARLPLRRALQQDLPQLERMYLDELMAEPDALEGLRAFIEKREPRWEKNREKKGMLA